MRSTTHVVTGSALKKGSPCIYDYMVVFIFNK